MKLYDDFRIADSSTLWEEHMSREEELDRNHYNAVRSGYDKYGKIPDLPAEIIAGAQRVVDRNPDDCPSGFAKALNGTLWGSLRNS